MSSPDPTLTPSTPAPTEEQIEKLCAKVRAAVHRSRVSKDHFQKGLGYPGTELEDEILAAVVRFSKKASGIIFPVAAHHSGLIPRGWRIKEDRPEPYIELDKLDFTTRLLRDNEQCVEAYTMRERVEELDAIGSLGLAAEIIKAQKQGMNVFPIDTSKFHKFIMPLTELFGSVACIGCFEWDDSKGWEFKFRILDHFFRNDIYLVRRKKQV